MLDIDYSGYDDFWDEVNKRSLSIEEAVCEGYFKSIEEAEDYLYSLEDDDDNL